jgi:deoxyribodipyrimidine photolyase
MIDATGLDSSYDKNAHTLRTLFQIAEILIQSCSTAAIVIRGEVLWFHERVLDLSRRLDGKEAYMFVRDGDYMEVLEEFFKRCHAEYSNRAIVSQMKSIMVDLRLRATRARMSVTMESIKIAEQRSKDLLL